MELSEFIKKDMENFIAEMALDPNNISLKTDGYVHSINKEFPSNSDSPETRMRTSLELPGLSSVDNSSIQMDEAVVPEDQVANYTFTEDYDKEMSKAIDEGEYGKAKNLLRHLKEKLLEYPNDSQEKKELKVLIQQLYEKYKLSLNDPELISNIVEVNKSKSLVNKHDDWDDMPVPQNQEITSSVQKSSQTVSSQTDDRLAVKKKEEERKMLEQARIEVEKKNLAKLHEEELSKKKAEQERLLKEKRLVERQRLAEESERKILAKINLIEQLEREKKYFEAASAYESLKSSTLLEDLAPERRITIFEDIKHLYARLRENLDEQYKEKIIHDNQTSLKNNLLRLETEVTKLIVANKLSESITAYKSLLYFFKKKQPEIPEELRNLTKKKLHLYHDKIQNLLKNNQRQRGRIENKQQKITKQISEQKFFSNPLTNNEKNLLHHEEKKLKGRP